MSNEIKSKEADVRSVADICKWLCERGFMRCVADAITAAHNREIGELKGERNGLLKANESIAADNTRLREENARLRALVKELADALNASCDCHRPCHGCDMADESKFDCAEKAERALVAKAREVVK